MTRSKTTRALTAGAAGMAIAASMIAVPTVASAQSAGYVQPYPYDACQRATTTRTTTGGLVGAAIGAAVGSQIAAHGNRTEGSVLGGLLGAAVGATVGKRSAACTPEGYPQSSYGGGYSQPYGYNSRPYGSDQYGYNDPYYNRGYDYGYGGGYNYPASASTGDDCRLAESPIYLPDGTTQKRFVRVCRDASGRYQVVD